MIGYSELIASPDLSNWQLAYYGYVKTGQCTPEKFLLDITKDGFYEYFDSNLSDGAFYCDFVEWDQLSFANKRVSIRVFTKEEEQFYAVSFCDTKQSFCEIPSKIRKMMGEFYELRAEFRYGYTGQVEEVEVDRSLAVLKNSMRKFLIKALVSNCKKIIKIVLNGTT